MTGLKLSALGKLNINGRILLGQVLLFKKIMLEPHCQIGRKFNKEIKENWNVLTLQFNDSP